MITKYALAPATRASETAHFRDWTLYCHKEFDTSEWRAPWDPFGEITQDVWYERESTLQKSFVAKTYFNMKPKCKDDPAAKPESVFRYLTSIRRVHKDRGRDFPNITDISKFLVALKRIYVTLHGAESLQPRRKAALTNDHTNAILSVPDNTQLRRPLSEVNWRDNTFTAFKAQAAVHDTPGGSEKGRSDTAQSRAIPHQRSQRLTTNDTESPRDECVGPHF